MSYGRHPGMLAPVGNRSGATAVEAAAQAIHRQGDDQHVQIARAAGGFSHIDFDRKAIVDRWGKLWREASA